MSDNRVVNYLAKQEAGKKAEEETKLEEILEELYKTKDSNQLLSIPEEEAKTGKKKTFRPGQHLFFKRYYLGNHVTSYYNLSRAIFGGQIEVPEGYQVVSFQNVVHKDYHGSIETCGFDIWFINVKRVEAEPVFNATLNIYDYSEPGTVVNTMVEEEAPILRKVNL